MVDAVLIGKVIQKCRVEKGMTQFKIAGALDVPPHQLMIEIENAVSEE